MGVEREGFISYCALREVHDRPDVRLNTPRNDKTLLSPAVRLPQCHGNLKLSMP